VRVDRPNAARLCAAALMFAGWMSAQAAAPGEPSAAHVALAREVVVASGVGNSFQVIIPQLLDQIGQSVSHQKPELSADVNVALPSIKLDFDKKIDEMVDTAARLYAQRLSQKELEDAAAFFKSPSGRKYVGTQPVLMTDMFVGLQAWSQKISGEMMIRLRDDLRKKGHEL